MLGDRRYSFNKRLITDNALDFSKRSSFVREVMLEKVYPTRLIVPMLQHYGVPAVPTVDVGEYVTIGQCIGAPEPGSFSVPIHSGISGTVTDIRDVFLPNGVKCRAVCIESDRKRTYHPSINPRSNVQISASEFMGIVKNAGIVGMGGEGIPTIAKINRARAEGVNEVLVNCLQSEPYSYSDFLRITDSADYIVMGAVALAGAVGVHRIRFLVSSKNGQEITALQAAMQRTAGEYSGYSFDFALFKSRFPQGYYRMVAKALYGKILGENDTLESTCHAVLFNCSTVFACWNAVADGLPLMSRVLTVTGEDGMGHNVLAPIGTPVSELLDSVNGKLETNNTIVWGSCLTGLVMNDPDNTPIIKTTSAVTIVRDADVHEYPCIHCGSCIEDCPMELEPGIVTMLIRQGRYDEADQEGARKCISCGACAYVCPSGLPLTSTIASFAATKRNSVASAYSTTEKIDIGSVTLMEAYDGYASAQEVKEDDTMVLPFEGGKFI